MKIFLKLKPNSENLIVEYIRTHPFEYPKQLPEYIKISSFLLFREIILNLCNHKDFKDWVMKQFIPKLTKDINEKYYIEIDWYKFTDHIISFLKTLFMKHLITNDTLTNKPFLFGEFLFNFDSMVQQYLPTSEFYLTPNAVVNLHISEMKNETMYHSLFNSFFKGAAMSKYLENYLQRAYSL